MATNISDAWRQREIERQGSSSEPQVGTVILLDDPFGKHLATLLKRSPVPKDRLLRAMCARGAGDFFVNTLHEIQFLRAELVTFKENATEDDIRRANLPEITKSLKTQEETLQKQAEKLKRINRDDIPPLRL